MASRRQTGASGDHSSAPDALVAAARQLLADHFPSAITGRLLAETAGVQYGQLHRHFESKSAVLGAAFESLVHDFAEFGTDEAGVPVPFGSRITPSFWMALTHLMLDRTTFDQLRPLNGVLDRAADGLRQRRPGLDTEQARAIVALGVSIELGVRIHRPVLGRSVGLDPNDPIVEQHVRRWLDGLYAGSGPLGHDPAPMSGLPIRPPSSVESGSVANAGGDAALSAAQRLIDAGARLLEDSAPSAISGRQLARVAGVNYGLIHHYFGTKEEVLRRSVQLHRDWFFAAYAGERAPGYFAVCEHPGYVRATTWGAVDPTLSVAEQRFPVMDLLLRQRLDSEVGRADELATRAAVFAVVSGQMAWVLLAEVFESAPDTELVLFERLAAPLLHRLLQAPQFEMGISV